MTLPTFERASPVSSPRFFCSPGSFAKPSEIFEITPNVLYPELPSPERSRNFSDARDLPRNRSSSESLSTSSLFTDDSYQKPEWTSSPPLPRPLSTGSWEQTGMPLRFSAGGDMETGRAETISQAQIPHSSLMALPTEVRVAILTECVGYLGPTISAKPYMTGQLYVNNHFHFKRILRERLHPLWQNRKMMAEANYVFYSKTEFRFSNDRKWREAASFLRLIGENILSIRHLAVHIPLGGVQCQPISRNRAEELIDKALRRADQRLPRLKFDIPMQGVQYCREMLVRALSLQTLKLILPFSHFVNDHEIPIDTLQEILEAIASDHRNLKITLIELGMVPRWKAQHKGPDSYPGGLGIFKHDETNHKPVIFRAERIGWEVEGQLYNAKGCYPVSPDDTGDEGEEGSAECSHEPPIRYRYEIYRHTIGG
ncbi:MAG: hypothetical protein M1822_001326 [Bathelium mastoideum]|nr:MAG: hypothetical protein M1822_001326 [Bathelium mastoideum]